MGPHFSVVGVGQEHGTRRGDADQRAVGALRDQALARSAQPSSGAGCGWSGPGAVVGGRGKRPPDPRLAGASRTPHESHAPHRNRSSGRSFNLPEGRLSKSVAKAPIAPERRRRIVDIPRFFSPPIPARGAFATDLDTPPPRTAPGAPHAPLPCPLTRTIMTIPTYEPAAAAGDDRTHRFVCRFRRSRVSFPPVSVKGRRGAPLGGL